MHDIIQQLRRLQRISRVLLTLQRSAVLLAVIGAAALVAGLIDYARPVSDVVRWIVWIAALLAVGWVIGTYIRRAARFKPALTDMALRVERFMPRVAGRLASAVEFVTAGVEKTNPLAARLVRETERRLAGESFSRVVRATRTLQCLAILLAVCAIIAVLFITTPTNARIGAQRVFVPWSATAWPARTGVRSRMSDTVSAANVYERGKALLLRAEVTRGDDQQRVDAMVRYQIDGRYQRWQQLVLTHQSNGLHERLIDTDATAVELYFQTADAETQRQRIELVPAPAVVRATLTVTPPEYAVDVVPTLSEELGPGIDDRSVASFASLVGSEARLSLRLNKTVPVPGGTRPSMDWIRSTFGWDAEQLPEFTIDPTDRQHWQLLWRMADTAELDLQLTDQYGLTNGEPITYRIGAREDRRPSVAITEPISDQVVLPTAIVDLHADAEDDVALAGMSLTARLRKAVSDQSTEVEQPVPQEAEIWSRTLTTTDVAANMVEQLDLSQFDLSIGDVVLVTAYARDGFELDGAPHKPAESAVRRLQVISELDYAAQVRRQLGGIRQNAIRIETLQGELQDDVIDDGVQPGVSRAQAQIGQRIAEQREMINQLAQDLQRNRFSDEQLGSLLDQTGELLDYAGRASTNAAQRIEQQQRQSQQSGESLSDTGESRGASSGDSEEQSQAAGSQSSQQPDGERSQQSGESQQTEDREQDQKQEFAQPAEEDREIVDAQQQVRDELADLIELLDRDEDTWVVTRRLENLLQQQQQLAEATEQLNQQTVGRQADELTQQEQSELQRIVEKQQQLSDEARDLIEESRERAEALSEIDPQASEGMRNAARTAEQRELDQDMQQAAQRAQQNQLNSSRAAQQSAAQTMQQMLDEIEQSRRTQTEQLLRQLASLLESIERLVNVQENELIALAQAAQTDEYDGRDRAMIRLNQNTIAVEGEARAAGQQARRIARSLDRAGDAQGAAVGALRAQPIDHDEALQAEERSLELLREAHQLAEELEQQTQEDQTRRQRQDLIEQYRALSEKQLAVRDDTIPLTEIAQLNRRQLVEARRLGNTQDEIRTALLDMEAATAELADAKAFSTMHKLINGWSEQVSESLWDAAVNTAVTDRQMRIARSIGLLIDALNESMAPPDEFEDGQSGQQGGGAGQGQQAGLIPPVAELKLIRGMQEQIYNQTKDIEASPAGDDSDRRLRLQELGRMQRELLEIGEAIINQMTQQRPGPEPTLDEPDTNPEPTQ